MIQSRHLQAQMDFQKSQQAGLIEGFQRSLAGSGGNFQVGGASGSSGGAPMNIRLQQPLYAGRDPLAGYKTFKPKQEISKIKCQSPIAFMEEQHTFET